MGEVIGRETGFQRDDTRINAYLARPQDGADLPGMVIIPDVHGLSDHYRRVAERFAADGYVALALDLYSREGAPTLGNLDEVNAWIAALPDRRILGDVGAAIRHLSDQPDVRHGSIVLTGFCMGGQYTLMAACEVGGIRAAVSWYGMLRYRETNDLKPASPLQLAPRLKCPYLGLFGADDPIIPVADVEQLRESLERERKTFEIEIYEGAGHAFFNDTRPEMYRPEVAERAYTRATTFLHEHLT